MKKTPVGTRALIREYLKAEAGDGDRKYLWAEGEIAKRIGKGNSILLDGKIITSHCGNLSEGKTSYWIFTSNRISLDTEDSKIPEILTPFDEPEEDEISSESIIDRKE